MCTASANEIACFFFRCFAKCWINIENQNDSRACCMNGMDRVSVRDADFKYLLNTHQCRHYPSTNQVDNGFALFTDYDVISVKRIN